MTITSSPYIKNADAEKMLRQEERLFFTSPPSDTGSLININRTLEEITLDVVKHVMNEENGNQSAVARRLGLSRTTLWRTLQKLN